jgi:hypothetical protein
MLALLLELLLHLLPLLMQVWVNLPPSALFILSVGCASIGEFTISVTIDCIASTQFLLLFPMAYPSIQTLELSLGCQLLPLIQ